MIKQLILITSLLSTTLYAQSPSANKYTINDLQARYDKMGKILVDTNTYFNAVISNMKATATTDDKIKDKRAEQTNKTRKIQAEIRKIERRIHEQIASVEDFLFIDTGRALYKHRFARKEYWTKRYIDHDINVLNKYCGVNIEKPSQLFVLNSEKKYITKKTKNLKPNCKLVVVNLKRELLSHYRNFIKNYEEHIKTSAVQATAPYSYNYQVNGDITKLANVLMPLLRTNEATDKYFHSYVSAIESKKPMAYDENSVVANIYIKQLEASLKSFMVKKIEEYKAVACCIQDEKEKSPEELKTATAIQKEYKKAVKELDELKTFATFENFKYLTTSKGVFKMPLVNPDTMKMEEMEISLKLRMKAFLKDLKTKI